MSACCNCVSVHDPGHIESLVATAAVLTNRIY